MTVHHIAFVDLCTTPLPLDVIHVWRRRRGHRRMFSLARIQINGSRLSNIVSSDRRR
jgi:hypothetical protein